MKVGWMLTLAALSLGLSGCDESMCSGMASAYEDYQAHLRSCGGSAPNLNPTLDEDACNDAVDEVCTDDDEEAMSDYMDCMRQLFSCKVGVEAVHEGARQCSAETRALLSAECRLYFEAFEVP
ncbi:hypothetical protein JY651_31115 [Pyxidicoccus parkwayensis]|uniref:Lipoprotein n=1 Tax=Pyxidicoccus parkwayensis TaxID=2813578 RepID=A0ABX7NLI8_9BACT|nr:hypothetical protein [Pyxidicoccus parkwaysis]QSQ19724.1 hypothetical protein JY651_31115 [Pyxidicoccus parkwaysis]